jgi:hypothetical protein
MTPTWSYATIRPAPVDGYIALTDGSRHVLVRTDDPGVPVTAQRRLNAARTGGKPPPAADLAEVARWLDRHAGLVQVQQELFDAA